MKDRYVVEKYLIVLVIFIFGTIYFGYVAVSQAGNLDRAEQTIQKQEIEILEYQNTLLRVEQSVAGIQKSIDELNKITEAKE